MSWLKANRVSAKEFSMSPVKLKRNSSLEAHDEKYSDKQQAIKIRESPSFSLEKKVSSSTIQSIKIPSKIEKSAPYVKLPELRRRVSISSSQKTQIKQLKQKGSGIIFYQTILYDAMKSFQNKYMYNQARVHFNQTIQILRMTKNFKIPNPKHVLQLQNKTGHKKTIYLDLDETLIHTDQTSNNFTVKLRFPIEAGGHIDAGVRIRPFCEQFLKQLAKIAQIIIFTASSSSYADVILDHLDPQKKYFSHRLYRQHCTLEGGLYIKDLRTINRKLEDVVIVDNSAFSYVLQKENGVPILPFYHYKQDKELVSLLEYLKKIVGSEDCRELVKQTFFWQEYLKENNLPKKIFLKHYKKLNI